MTQTFVIDVLGDDAPSHLRFQIGRTVKRKANDPIFEDSNSPIVVRERESDTEDVVVFELLGWGSSIEAAWKMAQGGDL